MSCRARLLYKSWHWYVYLAITIFFWVFLSNTLDLNNGPPSGKENCHSTHPKNVYKLLNFGSMHIFSNFRTIIIYIQISTVHLLSQNQFIVMSFIRLNLIVLFCCYIVSIQNIQGPTWLILYFYYKSNQHTQLLNPNHITFIVFSPIHFNLPCMYIALQNGHLQRGHIFEGLGSVNCWHPCSNPRGPNTVTFMPAGLKSPPFAISMHGT